MRHFPPGVLLHLYKYKSALFIEAMPVLQYVAILTGVENSIHQFIGINVKNKLNVFSTHLPEANFQGLEILELGHSLTINWRSHNFCVGPADSEI